MGWLVGCLLVDDPVLEFVGVVTVWVVSSAQQESINSTKTGDIFRARVRIYGSSNMARLPPLSIERSRPFFVFPSKRTIKLVSDHNPEREGVRDVIIIIILPHYWNRRKLRCRWLLFRDSGGKKKESLRSDADGGNAESGGDEHDCWFLVWKWWKKKRGKKWRSFGGRPQEQKWCG